MTDQVIDGKKVKKEAAVLSDSSLLNLAKELKQGNLEVFMYLNIPTITIVQLLYNAQKNCQSDITAAQKLLLYWKTMRATVKDTQRVNDLDRSLRDSGQPELADVIIERHRLNMELIPEVFRV